MVPVFRSNLSILAPSIQKIAVLLTDGVSCTKSIYEIYLCTEAMYGDRFPIKPEMTLRPGNDVPIGRKAGRSGWLSAKIAILSQIRAVCQIKTDILTYIPRQTLLAHLSLISWRHRNEVRSQDPSLRSGWQVPTFWCSHCQSEQSEESWKES